MANFTMNVNSNAAIILTAKLERLNKSAFPSAVRSTLNDAAFSMKQKEILDSAKRNMNVKSPTFFKKYTGVKRATGFNINSMYSESGFTDKHVSKAQKAVNYGMEANEIGATDSTGMKYYPKTRGGKGLVKRSQYFNKSKIDQDDKGGFISKAFRSIKNKKAVFITTKKGRALVRFKSIKKYKRGNKKKGISKGSFKFNSDILMMDRTHKKAKAKATHFNREAALKTQKQMDDFYLKAATFQFNKVLKSTR